MADFLTTVGIFLIRKGKDAEGGSEKVIVAGCGKVELDLANPEFYFVGVEGM
jgi:hypothetical protein